MGHIGTTNPTTPPTAEAEALASDLPPQKQWQPELRQHVLNVENGDSAKPGTNIEYMALLVGDCLVRKADSVPADVKSLVAELDTDNSTRARECKSLLVCVSIEHVCPTPADLPNHTEFDETLCAKMSLPRLRVDVQNHLVERQC